MQSPGLVQVQDVQQARFEGLQPATDVQVPLLRVLGDAVRDIRLSGVDGGHTVTAVRLDDGAPVDEIIVEERR